MDEQFERAAQALAEFREELDDELMEAISNPDADTPMARDVKAIIEQGWIPVFDNEERRGTWSPEE